MLLKSNIMPYEKLSIPLKYADAIGFFIPPITSDPIIDFDDDYKYIVVNTIDTDNSLIAHYKLDDDLQIVLVINRHLTPLQNLPVIPNDQFKYGSSSLQIIVCN